MKLIRPKLTIGLRTELIPHRFQIDLQAALSRADEESTVRALKMRATSKPQPATVDPVVCAEPETGQRWRNSNI